MNTGKTLFAQLMDFLPWSTFARLVTRYDGDRRAQSPDVRRHRPRRRDLHLAPRHLGSNGRGPAFRTVIQQLVRCLSAGR